MPMIGINDCSCGDWRKYMLYSADGGGTATQGDLIARCKITGHTPVGGLGFLSGGLSYHSSGALLLSIGADLTSTGICASIGTYLLESNDNGLTWLILETMDAATAYPMLHCRNGLGSTVLLWNENNIWQYTHPGGGFPTVIYPPFTPLEYRQAIAINADGTTALAISADDQTKVYRSTDGGANWQLAATLTFNANAVIHVKNNSWVIAGEKIAVSSDNGTTWHVRPQPAQISNITYLLPIERT